MTTNEMVDRWLRSIGMRRVSGDTFEPILPFFLLDAMYQLYCKEVKPIECKHELKQLKRRWIESYNALNRRFFMAFTPDEQGEVIDIMDEFEAYISNDVMITEVQVMNFLNDLPLDEQKRCAALIMCNILSQSAQIVWGNVYKTVRGSDSINPYIVAIEKCSSRFTSLYHDTLSKKKVDPNKSKAIVDAVNALSHKVISFLFKDMAVRK